LNRKWKNLKWIVTGIVLILLAVLSIRNIKFKSVETYQEEQAKLSASGVALNEEGQAQIVFEDGTSATVEELAEDTKEQVSPAAIQEKDNSSNKKESGKKTQKSSEKKSSSKETSNKETSNKENSSKEATNKDATNKDASHKKTSSNEGRTKIASSQTESQETSEVTANPASKGQEGETNKAEEAAASQATATPKPEDEAEYFECSIAINCYELAKDPSLMDERFRSYIPEDGVILEKCKLKVLEGTTAYDVLNAACKKEDIPMVSTYTAIYDTYYVRSIGYLSEKAAGAMSGWVYTVNGKSPNVGSSSYKLKEGDQVVWSYTVDGQR